MARPGVRHLTIWQGDDYSHPISFVDGAGAPISMAGRTFTAQIRRHPSDTTALASFAVNVTQAAAGVIVISLTDTQTRPLPGKSSWDFQEVVGSITTTILAGTVTSARDSTRA